jgi:hypothetical protein
MTQTYYDILGVSHDSSQEEIKAAYRKLAFKYHPDRNLDKESSDLKMKELNFIYSILSDAQKRNFYDSTISSGGPIDDCKDEYKPNVYIDFVIISDSKGRSSSVKVGDYIFQLVEIDKSVITWKYNRKEYFYVLVKHVFDDSKKSLFSKVIKYDLKRTPLFLVHWGNSEMIIYKEDYQMFWISSKTFKIKENIKGVVTGIVLAFLLSFSIYYFSRKFSIDNETKARIESFQKLKEDEVEEKIDYYKENYDASETEVNYIISEYYIPCSKEETITIEKVEILKFPDNLSISVGVIKKGERVVKLLQCPSLLKMKIKHGNVSGWVNVSKLENSFCANESNDDREY